MREAHRGYVLLFFLVLLSSSSVLAFGGGGKGRVSAKYKHGVDAIGAYYGGNESSDISFSCEDQNKTPDIHGICVCKNLGKTCTLDNTTAGYFDEDCRCVACLDSSNCETGKYCNKEGEVPMCSTCQQDMPCPTCPAEMPIWDEVKGCVQCTQSSQCGESVCAQCSEDNTCTTQARCCTENTDCPDPQICLPTHICGCTENNHCISGEYCDKQNCTLSFGTCKPFGDFTQDIFDGKLSRASTNTMTACSAQNWCTRQGMTLISIGTMSCYHPNSGNNKISDYSSTFGHCCTQSHSCSNWSAYWEGNIPTDENVLSFQYSPKIIQARRLFGEISMWTQSYYTAYNSPHKYMISLRDAVVVGMDPNNYYHAFCIGGAPCSAPEVYNSITNQCECPNNYYLINEICTPCPNGATSIGPNADHCDITNP